MPHQKKDYSNLLKEINRQPKNVKHMVHQPKKEHAIAYCHHNQHAGYLSSNLIDAHRCLDKQCPYLEKYETKEYWLKKRLIKVIQKHRKKNKKGYIIIGDKTYKTDDLNILYSSCCSYIATNNKAPEIQYLLIDNIEEYIDYILCLFFHI